MKITSVDIYKAVLPYHEPFRISLGVSEGTENVFVRINTESGLYGMGEASPTRTITGDNQAMLFAAAKELSHLLVGGNAIDIELHVRSMRRLLAGGTSIRGAFDVALYDLVGKTAGLPLYALLGGGARPFRTDNTVGIDSPAAMANKAATFQNEGYDAIKVKLGTSRAEDVARVRAIRQAVGTDMPLRIDANQGWDFPTAAAVLDELEPLDIQYCEQPVAHWDYISLRRLRGRTTIPIMADESVFDEHDALKLATGECCDYFNIKLAKSGGIHTALKINAIAEAAGILCMVGCMSETRLGLSAAAHLVSARPNIAFADLDSHFDHTIDPVVGGAVIGPEGIVLPHEPGHGADIDADFLASCDSIRVL